MHRAADSEDAVMIEQAGSRWLVAAFLFLASAVPALAAPRAPATDDAQAVDKLRVMQAGNAEKALQQQGGSRIVVKVDAEALREAVVTELRDDLYRILREGRVPHAGLAMHDGAVEVRIAQAADRQKVLSKLMPATEAAPWSAASIDVTDSGDGQIRLVPSKAGMAGRLRELVGQSIDMIEQRLRDSGISQAGLQRDGADGIRILLPGVSDPERATQTLVRKARITFRLVDASIPPREAAQGQVPASSEVVDDFKTKEPRLLLKDIAMQGDDIAYAGPGFAAHNHEPIVSFRFNARGARRFAQITTDNVARAFAIVVDDKVVSESVIREPITGGSGQISGNFTLEEANRMAMLMRSGTLPGRLSVLDQQVIEPRANDGK
ncbi:preprotein translocase subunit SecD [soil metagenome]